MGMHPQQSQNVGVICKCFESYLVTIPRLQEKSEDASGGQKTA